MKKLLCAVMGVLPGLILAVGVKTIFGPCVHADGSVSNCVACGEEVFHAGLLMIGMALARIVIPKGKRFAVDMALLLVSVCAALLPFLMQTCMMQTMRCNAVMRPAVLLIATAGTLLDICLLAGDIRMMKEKKHA